MNHVVMFSGGSGSWGAARRVADEHGTDDLTLLFADTKMEDEDLYRFLNEAAADVGGQFVKIADGRDPWQVFNDVGYLGNTRVDPCSRVLKRDLMRTWLDEHFDPAYTVVHLGIDWSEVHRLDRAKPRWAPWSVDAPLCEPPYLDKAQLLADLEQRGIKPPRLYEMGFAHNNCGGFCIKAGQGAFVTLLEKMPERYRHHEEQELAFQQAKGLPYTILRDRRGGRTTPLSLRDLRERVETGCPVDRANIGGCGCAVD